MLPHDEPALPPRGGEDGVRALALSEAVPSAEECL